jgi:hypothetical protein
VDGCVLFVANKMSQMVAAISGHAGSVEAHGYGGAGMVVGWVRSVGCRPAGRGVTDSTVCARLSTMARWLTVKTTCCSRM